MSVVITDVVMPQLGLEVTEATVLEVRVDLGEQVESDAVLVELETDKAITEVLAPRAGFVVRIAVSEGDVIPVGSQIAQIADSVEETGGGAEQPNPPSDGAAPREAADHNGSARRTDDSEALATGQPARSAPQPVDDSAATRRLRVAPVARRAAERMGIDLMQLRGTGPRGRITLRDVETASAAPAHARGSEAEVDAERRSPGAVEPFSGLRRTIARRMTASQLIPQYQLQRDVDASHLLAQKAAQAAADPQSRIGVNELLVQAAAETVVRHPALAASFVDGPTPGLRRHEKIDVGLAVATDRGLVVPVLRNAHLAGLRELAAERRRLVETARSGRLTGDDVAGAAVTLSNLGAFGVDRFTAMLNPGESAIIAVGRIVEHVVARGRAIVVAPILTITMSFDHRTVDGAVGGAALAELAELLEGAMTWRP